MEIKGWFKNSKIKDVVEEVDNRIVLQKVWFKVFKNEIIYEEDEEDKKDLCLVLVDNVSGFYKQNRNHED